ncbi:hypothetical protein [Lutibacter sp.]|uniref:hypothetical protein n=1 Tax=Lutibacter sp. TaxID=1925666 RepID=UPI001A253E37|nr:hypothetical protein [Lutibacter sp.]MBI9041720.1 hypothetical protein [Lutibacter sp.]
MKTNYIFYVLFYFMLNSQLAISQKHMSFEINDITKDDAWEATINTFKELKLPRISIYKNTTSTKSDYYNYSSLLVKNRLKFNVEFLNSNLIISLIDRQYLTSNKWQNNPLPMSKKKAAKILDPIKEKILEITKSKIITQNNANTSNSKKLESKKVGIYKDLLLVNTSNKEMDLLAIDSKGTIVGYDLTDETKKVKSIVFKESSDSESITILFNDQGAPTGMVTDHLIVNISIITENKAKLSVLDLQGNFIGENTIELPNSEQTIIKIQEKSNTHGPSNNEYFFNTSEDCFPCTLVNTSTITKALGCGAAIAAGTAVAGSSAGLAGPLAVAGVIAACESLYFDVVSKYVGNDHFAFDELVLASEISDGVAAALLLNFKGVGVTAKFFSTTSVFNSLVTNNINSYKNAKKLIEKYAPKKLNIQANNHSSYTSVIINANSNLNDKATIIKLAHEAMNKIETNETKIKTLQKAVELILTQTQDANDAKFLKIANDIKKIDDDSKNIRSEYGEKINKIAEKGTIEFSYKKTDQSQCYNIKGSVKTKGAHWSRPFLTILLEYNILPISCAEKLEYGAVFKGKGVSTITYKFIGEDNKEIMKVGSTITEFRTITMDINGFEQTELIEIFKSNH